MPRATRGKCRFEMWFSDRHWRWVMERSRRRGQSMVAVIRDLVEAEMQAEALVSTLSRGAMEGHYGDTGTERPMEAGS